ncbi:hypothetical protein, variant 4 [Verruconis gallopava]|uniref:Uncharacterized protein n=1 Tax=Verruconis gallopava TaxID=253628 RepID=A0A0D2AS02_9PEZI|nr:uncharacterized protein PV09_00230 [Verruconis gallopava]XP_016219185.1 hypothetical protein, variant 1 [Verruconis gallopava]XP_016219186.1 hypothetical protein, variant 2 [Verruconis gallopava]XP_016219187.1 hypothetical protein, variant 3 [Verruconis gallopava]XP_016219188.1 hypothetical protein, variant 4 [Verruconis gallopava]KIW09315.1 hypothetical protein PV09_00230 [Verruconis gallopava]KIW09316.1 hypothetical protein, variant 1 [Verruconis gallopava]KIW09317.1 hypothetical protei
MAYHFYRVRYLRVRNHIRSLGAHRDTFLQSRAAFHSHRCSLFGARIVHRLFHNGTTANEAYAGFNGRETLSTNGQAEAALFPAPTRAASHLRVATVTGWRQHQV